MSNQAPEQKRVSFSTWISAFRLRTLPLSFSVVIMGSATALQQKDLDVPLLIMTLLTTLFLQILSNLSNDYGDSASGADQAGRVGPERAVQSGAISMAQMKKAVRTFAVLSLLSGIGLLALAYMSIGPASTATLFGIGVLCIVAAITYTVGKHPYGYMGLGDLSVFIFFGLVGVVGSYFLQTGELSGEAWLPAVSVGALSCGVLNMNNMRDIESDTRAGKKTLPTHIGLRGAAVYQAGLMALAIASMVAYIAMFGMRAQAWCLVATIPFIANAINVLRRKDEHDFLDRQLKVISISTFAMSVIFIVATALAKTM